MVSYESDSNESNSDIDEDKVTSTQHTDGNIYAKDVAEAINDDNESVISI